jgi:hypothetical protein
MSSFSAYFSHSWKHHDLPLNLMLWEHISSKCHLVIDQPQPSSEEKKPYFISRLESVLRGTNMMLCCMPFVPGAESDVRRTGSVGAWRYSNCSPYILFEWRLAERLDLPRFMLYDRATRFQRPTHTAPHVRYVERNFRELQARIEAGQQDAQLLSELDEWLRWIAQNHTARSWTAPSRTACLLDPGSSLARSKPILNEAMEKGQFDPPEMLTSLFHTDSELYHVLRSIGLLIVDIRQQNLLPLYHAAHSLMVPTIRIGSFDDIDLTDDQAHLPTLLRGHPAGYQKDLLAFGRQTTEDQLFNRVADRTVAASRAARPIVGNEAGIAVLHERTYPQKHFVFISQDEKLNDRELIDDIVRELRAKGVTTWEYAVENRSGEDWRRRMQEALSRTTVMVALLSPTYEQSQGCKAEWKFAIDNKLKMLPFFTRGRIKTNEELPVNESTHQPLWETLPLQKRSRHVADRVINWIGNCPAN